jgi:hypothetical protein
MVTVDFFCAARRPQSCRRPFQAKGKRAEAAVAQMRLAAGSRRRRRRGLPQGRGPAAPGKRRRRGARPTRACRNTQLCKFLALIVAKIEQHGAAVEEDRRYDSVHSWLADARPVNLNPGVSLNFKRLFWK